MKKSVKIIISLLPIISFLLIVINFIFLLNIYNQVSSLKEKVYKGYKGQIEIQKTNFE